MPRVKSWIGGVLLLACGCTMAATALAQPAKPVATPVLVSPAPIASCDPGGCWDENGVRYDAAGGGVFIRRDGASCQSVRGSMVCK